MARSPIRPGDYRNFVEVMVSRAQEDPSHPTFTFHGDRAGSKQTLTAGDLDRRARAVAGTLQTLPGGAFGERILVLLPPGLDYLSAFFGCLYAGAIAVPTYPPGLANLGAACSRLQQLITDARPTALLANRELVGRREQIAAIISQADELDWISVEDAVADDRFAASEAISPESTALLQYTSGSTSRPKGVSISHGNLLHNTTEMRRLLGGRPSDRHVCWLPPYHDMGLVAGILMVPVFGMRVDLMSPMSFVKHPMRWIELMSETRATVSGGASFGFDLAARAGERHDLDGIDLRSLRVACIAAEPVRASTLDRFCRVFGPVGFERRAFLPCYGLAESTLMSTGGPHFAEPVVQRFDRTALREGRLVLREDERAVPLVANGAPIGDVDVTIVDPKTGRRVPDGSIGEIWVTGKSVAGGYWGKPEASADAFEARIDGDPRPFLRTGDLGGFHERELYVCGREKDVVIVRGQNHHPEDVEATAAGCHPVLAGRSCAVFSTSAEERESVHLVQEVVTRGLDREVVVAAIRSAVSEVHGLELDSIQLVRARTLPKTPSGKIRRQACREAFEQSTLAGVVWQWRRPRATRWSPAFDAGPGATERSALHG